MNGHAYQVLETCQHQTQRDGGNQCSYAINKKNVSWIRARQHDFGIFQSGCSQIYTTIHNILTPPSRIGHGFSLAKTITKS